ncbi:MAG: hypothetical protein KDB63_12470 [Nocardioidaceae bacterium]|nr:hypothetical protein [Nocardioidaceae bacterium]
MSRSRDKRQRLDSAIGKQTMASSPSAKGRPTATGQGGAKQAEAGKAAKDPGDSRWSFVAESWPRAILLAIIVAVLGVWLAPIASEISAPWRIVFSVILSATAVLWLLGQAKVLTLRWIAVFGTLVVASQAVFFVVSRPSTQERLVADYLNVCSDPMWGSQPVNCYSESRKFMLDHFRVYGPDRWNAFGSFSDDEAVNLGTLSRGGPLLNGNEVVSVGQVVDEQELGGLEIVIQLRAPTSAALSRLPPDLGLMRTDYARQVLTAHDSSESSKPGAPADSLVYLNVSARPFFAVEPGELIIFKGLPIATGYVIQPHTGRLIPMTYVRGASVEHLLARSAASQE